MVVQHENVACITKQFRSGAGDSYVALVDTRTTIGLYTTSLRPMTVPPDSSSALVKVNSRATEPQVMVTVDIFLTKADEFEKKMDRVQSERLGAAVYEIGIG